MKVDFRHIEATTSFDGNVSIIDVSEVISERMMFSGSVYLGHEFDTLAKEIHDSREEVEVKEKFIVTICEIVKDTPNLPACAKRAVILKLLGVK